MSRQSNGASLRPRWPLGLLLHFAVLAGGGPVAAQGQTSASPRASVPIQTQANASAAAPINTLKQAFDAAWARQPEQHAAAGRREAASAANEAAASWTVEPPSLGLLTKTDKLTGNRGAREYEVGVVVPLWLPGERERSQALAQAEERAVGSTLDAVRWRLAGVVREAWWLVLRGEADLQLARARLRSAALLAEDVARRHQAGDLSRADRHQAEAAVAAAEVELAEAAGARAQAAQALRALTGQAVAEALGEPAEALPAAAGLAPQASTLADATHPALRDLAQRAELARRMRELASVQTRANPELELSAMRARDAFGEAWGQTLNVGVVIPFGSDPRQRAKLASAGAAQTEAEVQLALERDQVHAEIAAAHLRIETAQATVDATGRGARLAAELRGFYEKSFRLGETDLPARLRVELEAVEAERRYARARIDLAQAHSMLRHAQGMVPQ
ncbi:MAG: TolC family protein [Ideonella sp.]|nr:TolC family protein [Ideonella sp.]